MTLPASALPIESPPAFLGVAQSATGKLWRDRLDARGAARALAIVQRYQLPEMLARVLAGRDVELARSPDERSDIRGRSLDWLTPHIAALMRATCWSNKNRTPRSDRSWDSDAGRWLDASIRSRIMEG